MSAAVGNPEVMVNGERAFYSHMPSPLEAMSSMDDTMNTAIKARMAEKLDDLDAQIDKLTVE